MIDVYNNDDDIYDSDDIEFYNHNQFERHDNKIYGNIKTYYIEIQKEQWIRTPKFKPICIDYKDYDNKNKLKKANLSFVNISGFLDNNSSNIYYWEHITI